MKRGEDLNWTQGEEMEIFSLLEKLPRFSQFSTWQCYFVAF